MVVIDRDVAADLCRRRGVRCLAVFGSMVTDRIDPESSDVDFLVEFSDDAPRTLDHYFGFKESLEAMVDRSVDLAEANPFVIGSIEASKEELYAA